MTTPTTPREPMLDATWTVNDVLRHHPATARVFNAFGVDSCCGGARTLAAAAYDDGVSVDDLLVGLRALVEAAS